VWLNTTTHLSGGGPTTRVASGGLSVLGPFCNPDDLFPDLRCQFCSAHAILSTPFYANRTAPGSLRCGGHCRRGCGPRGRPRETAHTLRRASQFGFGWAGTPCAPRVCAFCFTAGKGLPALPIRVRQANPAFGRTGTLRVISSGCAILAHFLAFLYRRLPSGLLVACMWLVCGYPVGGPVGAQSVPCWHTLPASHAPSKLSWSSDLFC
jgi:hypothetical protein